MSEQSSNPPSVLPIEGHTTAESDIDLDPLEATVAKYGLFIMKVDEALQKMPAVSGYEPARVALFDLRSMLDGHRKAVMAEIHQHRTPDV